MTESALVGAARAAPTAQPARPRRLTPARPASVLLPILFGWLLSVTAAAGIEAWVSHGRFGLGGPVLAGVLVSFVLLYFAVMRLLLRGRLRSVLAGLLAVPLVVAGALGIALIASAFVPRISLQPATIATIVLVPGIVVEAVARWRSRWLRHHPMRVSLLASSELAAEEAIDRLESIPGMYVESVVIPDCDVERAIRMLQRPTTRVVGGRVRLANRVIVSCPTPDVRVGAAIAQLVAMGHTITSKSAAMRQAEGRVDTQRANPLNLLLGARQARVSDMLRRVLDALASVVFLTVFSPLLLAVAIVILFDSGWPIFYAQERVGRRGRLFPVIKFRTMRKDAESISGPVFASEADPRITRVGGFLRHYRLDELPQFVNVVLGQMTLVGPRPERPHFFNALRRDVPLFEMRTCVKPGITGWAQVRLPYAADSEDARSKLEYDLYYVLRRSMLFDLAILCETLGVALTGAGAR